MISRGIGTIGGGGRLGAAQAVACAIAKMLGPASTGIFLVRRGVGGGCCADGGAFLAV